MILPKPDYRDPAEVAEQRQRRALRLTAKWTCAGCLLNRLQEDAYRCELAMPGFPLLGRDTCKWWAPRNERRRG
jgi:hypothetical protein